MISTSIGWSWECPTAVSSVSPPIPDSSTALLPQTSLHEHFRTTKDFRQHKTSIIYQTFATRVHIASCVFLLLFSKNRNPPWAFKLRLSKEPPSIASIKEFREAHWSTRSSILFWKYLGRVIENFSRWTMAVHIRSWLRRKPSRSELLSDRRCMGR